MFAVELLLPRARLTQELPLRLNLLWLLALQQRWGVSVEALLYRAGSSPSTAKPLAAAGA